VRRVFWATLGVGFGAVAAVGAMRWASRTRAALRPRSWLDVADDWRERLVDALEVGRDAMAEREQELLATYGPNGDAGSARGER
jgi:hypothetical protein